MLRENKDDNRWPRENNLSLKGSFFILFCKLFEEIQIIHKVHICRDTTDASQKDINEREF